ncbi:MAG: hypothetical protein ACKOAX_04790, partial [Candidatus Kapaibacterium sp.]
MVTVEKFHTRVQWTMVGGGRTAGTLDIGACRRGPAIVQFRNSLEITLIRSGYVISPNGVSTVGRMSSVKLAAEPSAPAMEM